MQRRARLASSHHGTSHDLVCHSVNTPQVHATPAWCLARTRCSKCASFSSVSSTKVLPKPRKNWWGNFRPHPTHKVGSNSGHRAATNSLGHRFAIKLCPLAAIQQGFRSLVRWMGRKVQKRTQRPQKSAGQVLLNTKNVEKLTVL